MVWRGCRPTEIGKGSAAKKCSLGRGAWLIGGADQACSGIKQLAGKSNMCEELIDVLPSIPKDLLRTNSDLARAVFSAQRLPIKCPLSIGDLLLARGKINMRG